MCYMTTTMVQPHQPAGSSACLEYYNPTTKIMAFDTIKTNKNHKTFPFTSPTITTHKNGPTGALILEIIFSSDDVSSPSTNKSQDEEGDNDEGGNSGESDDEDDAGSTDNSDSHSQDEEDDSSEGEEDNEDEEEDAEDSEEEHEEGGDEENFGTESFDDNDLVIDFGNENEDEEDQGLVIEFEESSPPISPSSHKSPRLSPTTTLPFWFTHEEPDQIRMIFESYGVTLDLEQQRKACVRSPAPFIGRITRTPIKPAESDTDKKSFKTLDKVEIYLREMYPLGTMLPLSRVAWVLTTWDANDGVPTHSVELQKSNKKSMQKRAQGAQSSTLYCTPVFRTKEEYQYTVSPQEHSLMYTSNSSTNASISRISPFLPEHCRIISFSLDY